MELSSETTTTKSSKTTSFNLSVSGPTRTFLRLHEESTSDIIPESNNTHLVSCNDLPPTYSEACGSSSNEFRSDTYSSSYPESSGPSVSSGYSGSHLSAPSRSSGSRHTSSSSTSKTTGYASSSKSGSSRSYAADTSGRGSSTTTQSHNVRTADPVVARRPRSPESPVPCHRPCCTSSNKLERKVRHFEARVRKSWRWF